MGWFKAYSLKGEIYKPFIKEYKLEKIIKQIFLCLGPYIVYLKYHEQGPKN